ncbi:UBA-like_superfamily [Hexamita inflata]|uniref:UBA-like superfamily n=1 Tax=Hexamita inflata TaxID=28002 RepID=A0AA86NNM3_9EUKA|nr:UBA-like superfamily [Hexamita inflata]
MQDQQIVNKFIEFTQCSQQLAETYLNKWNYEISSALNAFYDYNKVQENTIITQEPNKFMIYDMMKITHTSRENAIKYLKNSCNDVSIAANKYFDDHDQVEFEVTQEQHIQDLNNVQQGHVQNIFYQNSVYSNLNFE